MPSRKGRHRLLVNIMKWTKIVNYVFHITALIIQIGNYALDVVPPKWKPVITGVVSIAQIIAARKALLVNPDGTPATEPYKSEVK